MSEIVPLHLARPGDLLTQLHVGPVTRLDLALFCGASADHNPVHVDIDYARARGRPDVIAHGMLSAAYLGRMLHRLAPPGSIQKFSTRFLAVTDIGDELLCSAVLMQTEAGAGLAELALAVHKRSGAQTCSGRAVIRLPQI